jgi:hypothetical protein
MLELESLGALTLLPPGASVEHEESWFYFQNLSVSLDDPSLEAVLGPLLAGCAREERRGAV